MKKFKLNGTTYRLLEGVDEMNYKRSVEFKVWAQMVFEETSHSLFSATKERVVQYANEGRMYEAVQEVLNGIFVRLNETPNEDAMGRCFALICLRMDEKEGDSETWSDEHITEKLNELSENGLNRGKVEEAFLAFLKTSPVSYVLLRERMVQIKVVEEMLNSDESLNTLVNLQETMQDLTDMESSEKKQP